MISSECPEIYEWGFCAKSEKLAVGDFRFLFVVVSHRSTFVVAEVLMQRNRNFSGLSLIRYMYILDTFAYQKTALVEKWTNFFLSIKYWLTRKKREWRKKESPGCANLNPKNYSVKWKSLQEKNVFIAKELKLKIPSDKNNLKSVFRQDLGEIPVRDLSMFWRNIK